MSLLSFLFPSKPKSAVAAKERLQIIIARERSNGRQGPDFLPALHKELIEVISKYTKVNADDIKISLDRQGNPLPLTGRYTSSPAQIIPARDPYLPPGLSWLAPRDVERLLPLYAGARPWARDPLDFKQLSDIAEDRGQLINDETENNPEGLPRRKATQRAFVEADWNLADMSPKAGWPALPTT